MKKVTLVITNSGDGSNSIRWVTDRAVLEKMEERANDGDETYASGDGLQTRELTFPADFDIEAFFQTNRIRLTTLKDMG